MKQTARRTCSCTGPTEGAGSGRRWPRSCAPTGHAVYVPTLTGLGERAHLARPEIDLDTHIRDVLAVLEYERLDSVVLVGHSYAGMVITGVAERAPKRLAHLVYLDAIVPLDGEAMTALYDSAVVAAVLEQVEAEGDGWRVPPFEPDPDPRLTPHPLQTMTQALEVADPAAAALPRTYVACTQREGGISDGALERSAERAREAGWDYVELATTHYPMWMVPDRLVALLLELD